MDSRYSRTSDPGAVRPCAVRNARHRLGPYKFVSHTPGIELVMEAFEGSWRKVPSVKRLVFKSGQESTTPVPSFYPR